MRRRPTKVLKRWVDCGQVERPEKPPHVKQRTVPDQSEPRPERDDSRAHYRFAVAAGLCNERGGADDQTYGEERNFLPNRHAPLPKYVEKNQHERERDGC